MKIEDLFKPITVGSVVKVRNPTASLRPQQKVEILGFIDDNSEKPYCKECIPGGWIKPENIITEPTHVRFMTFMEIILSTTRPPYQHIGEVDPRLSTAFRDGMKSTVPASVSTVVNGIHYIRVSDGKQTVNIAITDITLADEPKMDMTDFSMRPDEDLQILLDGGKTEDKREYEELIKKEFKKISYEGDAINQRIFDLISRSKHQWQKTLTVKDYKIKVIFEFFLDHYSIYKGDICIVKAAVRQIYGSVRSFEGIKLA